jgi:large subunit ribosomal protein L18
MAKNNKVVLKFRRQRDGFTDYKKRLSLLKSGLPRIVIRKSLNYVTVQFVQYNKEGDNVIFSVSSKNLEKHGWNFKKNNVPAAYLTGFLAGTIAKQKIKKAIADIGRTPATVGNKVFATLKGVADAGIDVNISEKILPSEERIKGEHIANYAESLKKEDKAAYEKKFSKNIKAKALPENMPKIFEDVKKKLSTVKSE